MSPMKVLHYGPETLGHRFEAVEILAAERFHLEIVGIRINRDPLFYLILNTSRREPLYSMGSIFPRC
jgi:hypothetical protein